MGFLVEDESVSWKRIKGRREKENRVAGSLNERGRSEKIFVGKIFGFRVFIGMFSFCA